MPFLSSSSPSRSLFSSDLLDFLFSVLVCLLFCHISLSVLLPAPDVHCITGLTWSFLELRDRGLRLYGPWGLFTVQWEQKNKLFSCLSEFLWSVCFFPPVFVMSLSFKCTLLFIYLIYLLKCDLLLFTTKGSLGLQQLINKMYNHQ